MTNRDRRLRPDVDTSAHGRYRISVVDGEHILASAAGRRVDLLREGAFRPPVREAALSVTRDDDGVFLLDASFRTGPEARDRLTALGGDPLSVLLARRVAAGDQWAVKIVSGMGAVAAEVTRRLTSTPPEPAAETTRVGERGDAA